MLHLVTLLRFADLIGKFLNRPKVGGSRAVWIVAALLPVLQGLERDSVGARKKRLGSCQAFPGSLLRRQTQRPSRGRCWARVDMCNDFLHACDKLLVEIRECVGP